MNTLTFCYILFVVKEGIAMVRCSAYCYCIFAGEEDDHRQTCSHQDTGHHAATSSPVQLLLRLDRRAGTSPLPADGHGDAGLAGKVAGTRPRISTTSDSHHCRRHFRFRIRFGIRRRAHFSMRRRCWGGRGAVTW